MKTKERLGKIEEAIASLMYQLCGIDDNCTKEVQNFSEYWAQFYMPEISNFTKIEKICEYLGIEIMEDPPRKQERKVIVRKIEGKKIAAK